MGNEITSFRNDHAFLSNFHNSVFSENGKVFANVEQYFQYRKAVMFNDKETARLILGNPDPRSAKILGKRVKGFDQDKWRENALIIMLDALRLKFGQNPTLKAKLLATGSSTLIEGNEWNDTYWGVCRGKGENHLGKHLMRIRTSFQKEVESMELTFLDTDRNGYPVYLYNDRLYVDVDPRPNRPPKICTKYNNQFDGEADTEISETTKLVFLPSRHTC